MNQDDSNILLIGSSPVSEVVEPSTSDTPDRLSSHLLPNLAKSVDIGSHNRKIPIGISPSTADIDGNYQGASENPFPYPEENNTRSVGSMEGDPGWEPMARVTTVESDGGIRLAGGPQDLRSVLYDEVACTLPPPYHPYEA